MKRRSSCGPLLLFVACALVIGWNLLPIEQQAKLMGRFGSKTAAVTPPVRSAPGVPSSPVTPAAFPRTLTDARGKSVTLPAAPAHIISLAPNVTEILYALKLGDKLAADTLSCDYPPEAKRKPHIDPLRGDREKIEVRNPDLILAVEKLDSPALLDALEKDGMTVVVMKAENLQETYDGIQLIGKVTGQEKAADQLVQDMQARLAAVEKTVGAATDKPGVLMMYSDNPIYTTGAQSFISEVIRLAGGTNIITEPLPSEVIASEKVVERQPDVILCDKSLVPKVKLMPGWNVVPAVRENHFFQTSDKTTLVRPGPRLPIAVEELARYLHPDLFPK